ncbi:MAG: tetratricopeptide repeat protein, partial [Cyclobacteriaceae bacterium]|nr:tetratricopeptide repeat protein [Cyclobacteriaceae bacterium]
MVFEGNDVLGDGVNIASRLESDTKEGCITISGSVYRDIKNKAGIQTEFIGEKSFKNVDEPLKVYRVLCEEGVSKPAKNTNSKKSKNEKIKYFYYILAGMFIVSSVVFLIWEYLPQKRTKELDKSIAVLPFINMSNDPGHEYFSDGITEEIITQLANIKDLSVRSRTSVFQYKNNPKEIPQIGNELGVSYVLEGSVRRDQDMVRITIQLINAITDTHVWAENYDRKLEGVLEIQSEVAKKVAEMLDITLSSSEKKRIERKPTEKFTAYEYYLRAMHEDKKWTVEGSQKAVEYLEKALELDPEFSEAYSLYTWQYIQLSVTYPVMSTREALKLALPAAQKAVKYDSLSSDAYIMNASVNYYLEWNFEQAEKNFYKSLDLNSWGEAPIYQCYCTIMEFLLTNNRIDEAQELIDRIIRTEPTYYRAFAMEGLIFLSENDYKKALELIERQMHYIDSWMMYLLYGIVYHNMTDYETAIEKFEIGLSMANGRPPKLLTRLAMSYYRMERFEEAFEILDELLARYEKGEYGLGIPIALIYNEMEDEENTFKWLDIIYENRESNFLYLSFVDFRNLRDNPRYIALMRNIGFDY